MARKRSAGVPARSRSNWQRTSLQDPGSLVATVAAAGRDVPRSAFAVGAVMRCALLQIYVPAKVDFETEFGQQRGLDSASTMSLLLVGRVDHLNVICFVTGHHLIARNAIEHRVHDRPLRRSFAPATFRLFLRQVNYPG